MPLLTLKTQIHATPEVEAVLKEAMRSATKVYNGLLWHLREAYKKTGKVDLSRKNLNRILKELPQAKDYYSMSVQLTREEVIRNPPDPFPQHPPGHQWKRVWLRIRPGWVCR